MIPGKTAFSRLKSRPILLALILVLIILVPFGYSFVARVIPQGTEATEQFLERPDAKYDRCVKETTYMRFHHWELLRGVREEVVRYGMRGDIGLNKCMECHTSRERFCDVCHNAVSLTPDCFGCHYYP
jgi:hypothetical protein